ncbi:MAG: Arm DNA-binding domain-containing protein, partial [Pseudomonadota bacterium]
MLTISSIRAIQQPETGDVIVWDGPGGIRGFGVKVTAKSRRVFILQYRLGGRQGRTRRYTIGALGEDGWTIHKARKRASELRELINRGEDPMASHDARKSTPTVEQVWVRYFADQVERGRMRAAGKGNTKRRGWKPGTAKLNDRLATQFLLPRFGRRLTTELS